MPLFRATLPYRAMAHNSISQSVVAGNTDQIKLNVADYDTLGDFNLGTWQYKVRVNGFYALAARIEFLLNNNPELARLFVFANGAEVARGGAVEPRGGATNDLWALVGPAIVHLSAGDLIDLRFQNASATNAVTVNGGGVTWLAIHALSLGTS